MAASLIRKGVAFRFVRKGGPDFRTSAPFEGVGIECASLHRRDPLQGSDLHNKLRSVVEAKGQKPYAQPWNALALDTTALQAASLHHGAALVDPVNSDALLSLLALSGVSHFGALLLFWTQLVEREGRIVARASRYALITSAAIDDRLRLFLERHFTGEGHDALMRERYPPDGNPPNWSVPFLT